MPLRGKTIEGEDFDGGHYLTANMRKGGIRDMSGQRDREWVMAGEGEGWKQVHMINMVKGMARTRPHLSSATVYSARRGKATQERAREKGRKQTISKNTRDMRRRKQWIFGTNEKGGSPDREAMRTENQSEETKE